jgi:putative hydrolase
MHLVADTHTHTIASGHAYSTLADMVRAAAEKGLKAIAITDHGPAMPGGAHYFHFMNSRVWPETLCGVRILKGAEIDILDGDGKLDLPEDIRQVLELNIASTHPPTYTGSTGKTDITRAVLRAMETPHIHVIGHPDDSRFPLDFSELARAASDTGTLLEVNNNSLRPDGFRVNARSNCIEMLAQCEKYGARVTVSSDAHIDGDVGNFVYALDVLQETGFPEKLVANTSLDKLMKALQQK